MKPIRKHPDPFEVAEDKIISTPVLPAAAVVVKNIAAVVGDTSYSRQPNCKECEACVRPNCGRCAPCLDKKCFGGPGVRYERFFRGGGAVGFSI